MIWADLYRNSLLLYYIAEDSLTNLADHVHPALQTFFRDYCAILQDDNELINTIDVIAN